MKLHEIKDINEASYEGNIGAMEMFKFYDVATEDQKKIMKAFLNNKDFKKAWAYLQEVTGIKLK